MQGISVIWLMVGTAAAAGCASAHARPPEELPLAAGTTWTYAGKSVGKDLSFAVRVVDVKVDGERVVAALDGDLFDLPFGDGRRPSWLVRRGDRLYRSSSPNTDGVLWLDGPLAPGKKCCDPDEPRLCWVVEKQTTVTLSGVRGVAPVARTGWELVQRDNTGSYRVLLVAGVGIAELHYHHNGTPADVDVRLVGLAPGR